MPDEEPFPIPPDEPEAPGPSTPPGVSKEEQIRKMQEGRRRWIEVS